VNGILLIIMLLWILSNYNRYVTRLLFFYIASYIIITLGYQFSCFDHEKWNFKFQINNKYINVCTHLTIQILNCLLKIYVINYNLQVNIKTNVTNNTNTQREFETYVINSAELLGLKKIDTNTLLFNFLVFELCKYVVSI